MNKYEIIGILLVKLGDSPYTYSKFQTFSENGYKFTWEDYERPDDDEKPIFCAFKVEKDGNQTYFKVQGYISSDGDSKMSLGEIKEVKPKEKIVKIWD